MFHLFSNEGKISIFPLVLRCLPVQLGILASRFQSLRAQSNEHEKLLGPVPCCWDLNEFSKTRTLLRISSEWKDHASFSTIA